MNYEQTLSKTVKKQKGVVYTPRFVVEYLLDKTFWNIPAGDVKVIDPACGIGNFLIPAVLHIHRCTKKPVYQIIEENIFGIDCDSRAVEQLKFQLITIAQIIDRITPKTNIFLGNSTDKSFLKTLGQYDVVIGNPPYVRIQNIPPKERKFLRHWKFTAGNTDLYIPFIELAFELMNDNGVLGYVVSNGYLKNKSTQEVVKWLLGSQNVIEIADFGKHQLFPQATTYTSILLCNKQKNNTMRIRLPKPCFGRRLKDQEANLHTDLNTHLKTFPVNPSTLLIPPEDEQFIKRMESQQYVLKDHVRISVGLATLADKVFFLSEYEEYDDYVQVDKHKIEKGILRPCIKVSRIKSEHDIPLMQRYVVFPYHIKDQKAVPLTEQELKTQYPYAYIYLRSHYKTLMSRDRGKIDSDRWFLYGRTQGLVNLVGKKLLMPPLVQQATFVECLDEDLIYLSGYAIFVKSGLLGLPTVKKILESGLFKKYLQLKGKDFREGWKSCTKHVIQNFSIPQIDGEDWLKLSDKALDDFLETVYR